MGEVLRYFIMKKLQDISHQYFKFKFQDKGWKTKFFNSESKLIRYIKKFKPNDCYESQHFYYFNSNPKDEKHKTLIKKRSVIDLDNTSRENAIDCVGLTKGYGIDKIRQTSENSLQIVFKRYCDEELKDILDKNKIIYCNSTLKGDENGVIRLLHYDSIHHSGFKTRDLDENLSDFKGLAKKEAKKEKKKQEFFFKFIRSRVDGIKKNDRSVLFYKSKFLNLKRIHFLQEKFNLGDFFILEYPKEELKYGVLSVKAIQNSQIVKIQKSKPLIRTSKKRNGALVISPEPKLIKIIPKETKGYFSKTHLSWLREKFNIKNKYEFEIGSPYKESIGGFNF